MRQTNRTQKKCPCCNVAPRELHSPTCKRTLKRAFALAKYNTKYRARVRDNEILQSRAKRRKKLYRRRCSGGAATPTRRSGHAFVGNEIVCHRSEFFSPSTPIYYCWLSFAYNELCRTYTAHMRTANSSKYWKFRQQMKAVLSPRTQSCVSVTTVFVTTRDAL